jgi:hypothetical protein
MYIMERAGGFGQNLRANAIGGDPQNVIMYQRRRLWKCVGPAHPVIMPVPRHIIEQFKQLIPPLNGSLHKGQSGPSVTRSMAIPTLFNGIMIDRSSRCARRCTRVSIAE